MFDMSQLPQLPPFTPLKRVDFREKLLQIEQALKEKLESGELQPDECKLTHHFTPMNEDYGCYTYAREIFIPKGSRLIGKIHKHEHLNFIMKGKVSVVTESGIKYLEAPCVFVSELGAKRVVRAEEDTTWVTVHLVKTILLDKIEDEVIAKTYEEIGLISTSQANIVLGEN